MLFLSTDYLLSWEHLFIQCFWWPICRLRETSQLTSWQIQLAILILEDQRGASGILTTVAAVRIVRIFGLMAIQMMEKSLGRHLIKWGDEIICHVSINYVLQLCSFPHITGEVVHGGLYIPILVIQRTIPRFLSWTNLCHSIKFELYHLHQISMPSFRTEEV